MVDQESTGGCERPFFFIVVTWGERFRNFFLDYSLPSLLAPGNIPRLSGRRPARFLIATTPLDWEAMRRTQIFQVLERYAEPVLLELPPCPSGQPGWERSIVGHKLCCDAVHDARGYKVLVVPDTVYSDGVVSRLHELALAGAQAVLINVLPRIAEETFFVTLAEMGMLPGGNPRDTGLPLAYSGRQLVAAALRSMHSMSVVNEWTAPHFCDYAAAPWWRVPGEVGIVTCGMGWNPILIDHSAVREHDSSFLDVRGLDGDYDMHTIGGLSRVYAIRDSDECYAASWGPLSTQRCVQRRQIWGELGKGTAFRASYHGPPFNWLHRATLFLPVRLHAGPLNEKWDVVEDEVFQTLLTWLDPPAELRGLVRDFPEAARDIAVIEGRIARCHLPWWRRNATAWYVFRRFLLPLAAWLLHPKTSFCRSFPRHAALLGGAAVLGHRVLLALRGDLVARRWWSWRFRKLLADAIGRSFPEPKPRIPE